MCKEAGSSVRASCKYAFWWHVRHVLAAAEDDSSRHAHRPFMTKAYLSNVPNASDTAARSVASSLDPAAAKR